jgi:hypothetical protein
MRNWDYRLCWLRDATLTLYALLSSGYRREARAWREWLLRAVAGHPAEMQIMYGLSGERRLTEYEIDWLPGYADSRPVRVGNAASDQFQLDVYGELMDALHAGHFGIIHGEYNGRWLLNHARRRDVCELIVDTPYRLGKLVGAELELYDRWHAELERFFETNYVLIRRDSPLCGLGSVVQFDRSSVGVTGH